MALDNEARIPVYINDEQAKAALKTLTAEGEKLRQKMAQALAAGDMKGWKEADKEFKKINNEANKLKQASFDVNRILENLSSASMKDLRKTLTSLRREQEGLNRDSKEYISIQQRIDRVNAEMRGVNSTMTQQKGIVGSLIGGMKGLLPAMGIGAIVAGIGSIGRNVIQTRTEFSRFEAVLKNTLGSQSAANKAFGELKKFAADTPFQLNELTESYVKLTNQGFQPSMEEMTKLGDLASAMGKPFTQLTEAIIDAQTGENERLKEFGIKAKKEGEVIKYTFKGVTTEVANNSEAIRNYVLSLGDLEGVKGGMNEISKTVGGAISNSKDAVDNLWNMIGERIEPIVVKVLGWFSEMLNKISNWIGEAGGGFDQLYNWFAEFYNKSLPVRAAVEGIEVVFTAAFTVIKAQFQAIFNIFKTAGQLIKAIFTGNFDDIPRLLKASIENQNKIVTDSAAKLAKKAKDSWNDTLNGKLEFRTKIVTEEEKISTGNKKPTGSPEMDDKKVKAAQKKILEALDQAYQERLLLIEQQHVKERTSVDQLNIAKAIAERAYLEQKMALLTQYGDSTIDIQRKLLETELAIIAESDKKILELREKNISEFDAYIQSQLTSEQKALDREVDQSVKAGEKANDQAEEFKDDQLDRNKELAMSYLDLAAQIGESFGQMLTDQEASFGDFLKNTLVMALDALEKIMILSITESTIKGIAQGPLGILKAAAKIIAIKAAFGAVKGLIANSGRKESNGYSAGGYTGKGGTLQPAGIVHKGEYVIPKHLLENPKIAGVVDMIELARLSGNMAQMNMPVSKYASGGFVNDSTDGLSPDDVRRLTAAIEKFTAKKLVVYAETIKKEIDNLDHINKSRNM